MNKTTEKPRRGRWMAVLAIIAALILIFAGTSLHSAIVAEKQAEEIREVFRQPERLLRDVSVMYTTDQVESIDKDDLYEAMRSSELRKVSAKESVSLHKCGLWFRFTIIDRDAERIAFEDADLRWYPEDNCLKVVYKGQIFFAVSDAWSTVFEKEAA